MRLPESSNFQQLKAVNRATTLSHFLENVRENEINVLKRLQKIEQSHLTKPAFKDVRECLQWERKQKSERHKSRYIMEFIADINDVTRKFVCQNKNKAKCAEHHPSRFSGHLMLTVTKDIAESTSVFMRSLCGYICKLSKDLEKAHKEIVEQKNYMEFEGQKEQILKEAEIEKYQKAERKFDQLATNIYWFASNIAEKQRQTYGV